MGSTASSASSPPVGASITITGHYEGSTEDILRAVWTELLPALPTA